MMFKENYYFPPKSNLPETLFPIALFPNVQLFCDITCNFKGLKVVL